MDAVIALVLLSFLVLLGLAAQQWGVDSRSSAFDSR